MKSRNPPENREVFDAALDPKALEAIGRAIRENYGDLVRAPLPDEFLDLLARLEAKEQLSDQAKRPGLPGNGLPTLTG
jgi:hypothetical protein